MWWKRRHDQVFSIGSGGAAAQLARQWRLDYPLLSGLVRLPKAEVPFFPGARARDLAAEVDPLPVPVRGFLSENECQARFAGDAYELRGFGRTLFPPETLDFLGPDYANPATGEVDLFASFAALTRTIPHHDVLLEGEAFDLGTFPGYYRYLPKINERCPRTG